MSSNLYQNNILNTMLQKDGKGIIPLKKKGINPTYAANLNTGSGTTATLGATTETGGASTVVTGTPILQPQYVENLATGTDPVSAPPVDPNASGTSTPTGSTVESSGEQGTGTNTEGTDTGSTGTGSTSTGDTYLDYLMGQDKIFADDRDATIQDSKDRRDDTLEAIEQQRVAAEKDASVTKERAVVDARTSYAQNLATYGANAEAMASMGLSGSGYGDYLSSRAYAQQRADTQAANAQEIASNRATKNEANQAIREANALHEQNVSNANATYRQNVNNNAGLIAQYVEQTKAKEESEESSKNAAYTTLMGYAKSGEYTAEEIRDLATREGLSEEEISVLVGIVARNEFDAGVSLDTSNADIDAAVNGGAISAEQGEEYKAEKNALAIQGMEACVASGDANAIAECMTEAESLYSAGEITKETYQTIHAINLRSSLNGVTSISTMLSAVEEINKAKNADKLSNADYQEILSSVYDKGGGVVVLPAGYTFDSTKFNGSVKDEKFVSLLNCMITGNRAKSPDNGTAVCICGEVYYFIKGENGDVWYNVKDNIKNPEGISGSSVPAPFRSYVPDNRGSGALSDLNVMTYEQFLRQ